MGVFARRNASARDIRASTINNAPTALALRES
jgi:hypothetical protein